jgi:nucleoside-diphosphate-sugar epimerase
MNKRILITGNLGYIGPNVTKHFKQRGYEVYGQDIGLFDEDLLIPLDYLERPQIQSYQDVRDGLSFKDVEIDTVLYLAAVSNDPIGDTYESATNEINHSAAIRCYNEANKRGVKRFIYASSCSVYGFNEEAVSESSHLNPLTSYAKSKINAELDLKAIADKTKVICFRFATACGLSKRLRLDLVLNDFVINAINTGRIDILSDGKPKRQSYG